MPDFPLMPDLRCLGTRDTRPTREYAGYRDGAVGQSCFTAAMSSSSFTLSATTALPLPSAALKRIP